MSHTHPTLTPSPGTHLGPLLSGPRQIQLAVPGAYEKPQLLPLQPPTEMGVPAMFTFHVNPVLSSRLEVGLGEKLMVQVSDVTWEGANDKISPVWTRPLSLHSECFLCRATRGPRRSPRPASLASCSHLWP